MPPPPPPPRRPTRIRTEATMSDALAFLLGAAVMLLLCTQGVI